MIFSWEQRKHLCSPMGLHYRFGGDSSSSQTSENVDMRVVGGDDSINTSLKVGGSNNVITTTDHEAVRGGTQVALKGIELADRTARDVVASSGGLLEGALRMVSQQQEQFTTTVKDIKTSDVRVLVIGGLAVVGLAAVMALKKG
jgi:hypothetical protein